MNERNLLELVKLVDGTARSDTEKLEALAAMADAPPEDFSPKMKLPTMNDLPAYRLGNGGLGSKIANLDYGVPAPVPGEKSISDSPPSIGELLVGDNDA